MPLGDDVRSGEFSVADDESVGGDGNFHRCGFGLPEEIGELAIAVLTRSFEAVNFSNRTDEENIEK